MSESLKSVEVVVAVGSVDGVCTAAAVLRHATPNCEVIFTQAFQVDQLDPAAWGEGKKVLFVDLAVNNKDPNRTTDFLRRVVAAGHELIGVCDEHDADAWKAAFEAAELDYGALALRPVSGKGTATPSSGALLMSVLGDQADLHTVELCLAADAADRMDFTTHFGGIVNQAVKSKIADDGRRVYLARHFAQYHESDSTIQGWVAEYDRILATHAEIIGSRQELGDGLVRVVTIGRTIDVTTFMAQLYGLGYKVVVIDGEVFVPATKTKERQISFGAAPQVKVDLLAALKAAGINAGGMAAKANVSPADEAAAIGIVKAVLAAATS